MGTVSVAVASIVSERLDLVSLSADDIEHLFDGSTALNLPEGWPDEHDARFLRFRAEQMRTDPHAQQWLVRLVVLRDEGRPVIGHAGFHGPPGVNARRDPEAVEIGYTVFLSHRGRGYATEAARALMGWACADRRIERFVASVAPDNGPSLAIVDKLGFVQTGQHWDDEDGLELEFGLDVQSSSL